MSKASNPSATFNKLADLALKPLQTAINRYLSMDPELPSRLAEFEGKVLCLEFRGPVFKLYLLPQQGQIRLAAAHRGHVDAVISGSPVAVLKLGLQQDAAPLLFAREVEISGDTRLGRRFRKLLSEIEIDREEQLSRLIGDAASHRIFRVFHSMGQWGRRAAGNLSDDAGEYLREESRDVVADAELQQFYQQVDELRDDTERLQARLSRLRAACPQDKP